MTLNAANRPKGMVLRIHPLFLCLLVLAASVGLVWETVVVFVVVLLHEWAHAITATALGYRVREITLFPFGGVAVIERESPSWSPRDEVWIAAAGPLCNGLLVLAALVLYSAHLWSEGFSTFFVRANLTMALFNLLPALPLDGGRIWRAVGSRVYGYQRAGEMAVRSAFACSAALLAVGTGAWLWGTPHAGMWGMALFLAVSAYRVKRQLPYDAARWLNRFRGATRREPAVVRAIAASEKTRGGELVRHLAPDAFHVIYVLNEAGELVSVLEEKYFLERLLEPGGFAKSLKEWIEE